MTQIENILTQFRSLSVLQRQQVLEMIIAEFAGMDMISPEVMAVNRQRLADYDTGKVVAIPRKQAMDAIRQDRLPRS